MKGENDTLPSPGIGNVVKAKVKWGGSKIPLTSSTDIKSKYSNFDCLKKFKNSQNKWEEQIQTGNPDISLIDESSEGLSGCLMVEYYKQTGENQKWKGGFKLVWSVSSSNDGALTTVINADTSAGKLVLDSSIYTVSSVGNIKHKEEGKSKEISSDSDLSEYFPKIGNSLKNGGSGDYWGFKPEVNKICGDGECTGITENKTTTSKQWIWSKNGSGGSSITDWSSNFDNWFLKLFDSKWSDVQSSLKNIKGKWTLNTSFK